MKLIALLFFPLLNFSQIKMTKTTLLNGKVELMVPADLHEMTDEMWTVKYHSNKKPAFVLTDDNGEVNLIADHTSQALDPSQLGQYVDFRIANVKKTHPEMTVLDSSVTVVNGHKMGGFKFITQAQDQKIFNDYFFTLVDGKVLLFTFNCTEQLRSKWEKTADDLVASVKTK